MGLKAILLTWPTISCNKQVWTKQSASQHFILQKKKHQKIKPKTCQWIFTISIQLKKKLQLLIWRNMNSLSPKILCVKFNKNLQTCLLLEISFSMNLLLLHYYLPLALIFFFMPSIIRWENKIKRHIPCKMALLAKST